MKATAQNTQKDFNPKEALTLEDLEHVTGGLFDIFLYKELDGGARYQVVKFNYTPGPKILMGIMAEVNLARILLGSTGTFIDKADWEAYKKANSFHDLSTFGNAFVKSPL